MAFKRHGPSHLRDNIVLVVLVTLVVFFVASL